ncbi:hypothetical protein ACE1SV_64230 [Streptomyces sennicomposti]
MAGTAAAVHSLTKTRRLWPALVGWFPVTAATAEARQAEMRSVLGGVPVSRVMTPDPATVPDAATPGLAAACPASPFSATVPRSASDPLAFPAPARHLACASWLRGAMRDRPVRAAAGSGCASCPRPGW